MLMLNEKEVKTGVAVDIPEKEINNVIGSHSARSSACPQP